ncbi:ABC transporter ATP-binding protein [Actinoplanes teichomyceticus]|uniref:ATP-binding cassette subfamily B protein n=1 Tax=Actinoplanes teichomyceticus TaxID=1867 RepID=A0A561WA43_ACTTI|nr:ABC transporter ATP-binding protein [Actinoplanes teichomyceticus]TWG20723.1 ATP-binding cassette subfamily B protein [Actinoplanes teichomyceticus]GIF14379.1 ABC transporter ATP-binding protein [Actinoplanes teichomyceticus]
MLTFGAVVRRSRLWLPLIALTAVTGSLSALALPTVLGRAVDAVLADGHGGRWLLWATILIAAGVLVDVVDAFAAGACVAGATAWLRERLVRHVLTLDSRGAARFEPGDLVSRVSANAPDAAQAGPSVVLTFTALFAPVGSLVLLALIDWWLAVAFLAASALVAVVLVTFTRRTSRLLAGYQRIQGTMAGRLAESLAGARTIAAAGTVEQERRRILQPLPELRAQGLLSWLALARASAQAAVVGPLVLVAVLGAGGLGLVAGRITAGELFAAGQYAMLGAGLGTLTGVLGRLARARAGVRRLAEVFAVPPMTYGTAGLPPGAGTLRFAGVTVRDGDRRLLDRVDLTVPGGSTVAVVGRSGAGKSTLAALACRLLEPDEGTVLLDGVPLPAVRHEALRAAAGCAFERPVLVGATVGDAIGVGRDAGTVRAAARATEAHRFVSRLPAGYATPLAETPMSGGEAQRLGLARAWPADRLLVLDDATSSLDVVTEMLIHRALAADGERRTRLLVTHRAATAARADTVIWLDGGRVRAMAPHRTLWADPAYREVFG